MVNANWDEVDVKIEPGEYKAQITQCIEKASKKGTPMVEVKMLIDENQKFEGQPITGFISLTPKMKWMFKRFAEATGRELKGTADINVSDFVGKTVGIIVDEQEFKGNMLHQVKGYFNFDEKKSREAEEDSKVEEEKSLEDAPF